MKITNVYLKAGVPNQQLVGDGTTTIEDVLDDIRGATFDGVVVLPETHQYAIEQFHELLDKDSYDKESVQLIPCLIHKHKVHVPERGPYSGQPVRCVGADRMVNGKRVKGNGAVYAVEIVPATPATTKEIDVRQYHSFRNAARARYIASKLPKHTRVVVVWEPFVEAGDLDFISELPEHVELVIFHPISDKVGVVVEGDPDNWEAAFPVMGECELPPIHPIVDELLIPKGIHVAAGAPEAFKTSAMMELCAAILEGRKVFDHFDVRKQHEILFLCPDMSPELFQSYARPFGLMNQQGFRWQNPKQDVFHSVDSPVLQQAVKDRLLILDTMWDYAQIQKGFESGEWVVFFKKLRRLINVFGCVSIIMLVHPTKSGAKSNMIDPADYLKDWLVILWAIIRRHVASAR
jgi:hypothetical protein